MFQAATLFENDAIRVARSRKGREQNEEKKMCASHVLFNLTQKSGDTPT